MNSIIKYFRLFRRRLSLALLLGGTVCALFIAGCKRYVEIPGPTTSISAANVYTSDATAIAVLTGIYINMAQYSLFPGGGYLNSSSLVMGLCADELDLYAGANNQGLNLYYTNALYSNDANIGEIDYWNNIYPVVFICNSALEGLKSSSGLTPAVKQQLTGEAAFMRAYCYYNLVCLYGGLPIVTSTDYTTNSLLPRSSADSVWKQIISDLKDAQGLLSNNYLDATVLKTTQDRVRPTQAAATAMLARAYLYTGDWPNAEAQASSIINNNTVYGLDTLNGVFLANSSEAIWQLQPTIYGVNTGEALTFIIPSTGFDNFVNTVQMSNRQLNSFETGDQRRKKWVDSTILSGTSYYYAYKYKVNTLNAPVTEYLMMFRLAEQYLIRSEARAQQGDLTGAADDLNTIRTRAGLPHTTASTLPDLLTAILHERQTELFTEWGQRWFDLKRMNAVDSVMSVVEPLKGGGAWKSYQQNFPIPLYELQHDVNLKQNDGY